MNPHNLKDDFIRFCNLFKKIMGSGEKMDGKILHFFLINLCCLTTPPHIKELTYLLSCSHVSIHVARSSDRETGFYFVLITKPVTMIYIKSGFYP